MSGEASIRAWVAEDFGVELAALERVHGGADANAQLWRGRDARGRRWAVKWTGGGSPAGLGVCAELARAGVPGVAAPRTTSDGRLWSVRAGRRLSLLPWLRGRGALDPPMGEGHWIAFGTLLARVHASPIGGELRALLPAESHTHDRVAETWRALGRTRPEDDLVRSALSAARLLLERADALGERLRLRPLSPAICHGDPHLLNLLVDGEALWLIDWDDVVLAPRERDLLFVLDGGVLPFAPVTAEQQAWFFAGYGPVELDRERLAYHRAVRALEELVFPSAQLLEPGRASELDREEARAILAGVLSPTGLVRVAL